MIYIYSKTMADKLKCKFVTPYNISHRLAPMSWSLQLARLVLSSCFRGNWHQRILASSGNRWGDTCLGASNVWWYQGTADGYSPSTDPRHHLFFNFKYTLLEKCFISCWTIYQLSTSLAPIAKRCSPFREGSNLVLTTPPITEQPRVTIAIFELDVNRAKGWM